MNIISLKEAKAKGLRYYYTGKLCKSGHDSIRMVKGGSCKECKDNYRKLYCEKIENKEKIRDYHKERHKKTYSTEKRRESYEKRLEENIFYRAKKRAEQKNINFDIEISDIVIPDICPILGIKISKKVDGKKEHSPSLDKKIPELGYVKGNIVVISNRANRIKSDATVEEIEKLLRYMQG